jgi:hypothetical protein
MRDRMRSEVYENDTKGWTTDGRVSVRKKSTTTA